ncbi:MAG TPA: DUF3187 family protein [Gemmatimonadales bacterium]|nr:DUF3187 family protein [Gemmatimonadales bacterium]
MKCSRIVVALAAMALSLATSAVAQGLPAYVPINPVTTSRSALYFQPYEAPGPGWRATAQFDWSSIVEYQVVSGEHFWLFDAEILRLDLTMVKDYGPGTFLLVSAGGARVIDGVMDEFFDWYHDLIGLPGGARTLRPTNEFGYGARLRGKDVLTWGKPGLMLTDVKLGVGVRNTPSIQTLIFVSLPTTTHQRGYGRGTVSANGIITARSQLSERLYYEGSVGMGWTPRHGDLEAFQKTFFWSGSSGLRFRFWGRQAMFFNAFYQTSSYHDSGLKRLDRAELTADMGFLIRPGRNAPELILALTEDLLPSGPAVDATFRIGLRW